MSFVDTLQVLDTQNSTNTGHCPFSELCIIGNWLYSHVHVVGCHYADMFYYKITFVRVTTQARS